MFAGAVTLALAFGAREAVASPAQAARAFCSNHSQCVPYCAAKYPGVPMDWVGCGGGFRECLF